MALGLLHRDRRGTIWFYAGLGVVRAITITLILGMVAAAGFIWLRPFIASQFPGETPSPTPSVTVTYTPSPSPSDTPSPSPSDSPSTPTTPSPSDTPTTPSEPATTPPTTPPKTTEPPPPPTTKAPVITTKDVAIGYQTQRVNDPGLAKGKTEVRQKGIEGVRRITYTDGVETGNVVLRSPVDEIIAVGTYVAPPPVTQPPPQPKYTSVSVTMSCSVGGVTITGTASGGSNIQSTVISGAGSASGVTSAVVSGGPAGRYIVTVTGVGPRASIRWSGPAGACSNG